jgi:predicted membrane channel-forming protein YqfA (hemolysin III family)
MELAIWLTVGAVAFAGFIFLATFRRLTPRIIQVDYKPCAGGWYESHLNNCQAGLFKIPQQPVNTYSNLAYLAAGVFIDCWLGTAPSFVFFGTMTYLCIGSSLYHATSTRWAGMLDVTAIYSAYSTLAVYSLFTLLGVNAVITPFAMFFVAGGAAYFLSKHFRRDMNLKIGIFLGMAYFFSLVKMWSKGDWNAWPMLVGSFVSFGVAYIIWNMDVKRSFPIKRWGHGIWHILTALASGLLFEGIYLTA